MINELGEKKLVIIGAMIFRFEEVKFTYLRWTFKNWLFYLLMTAGIKTLQGLYIMTLGVVNELRQKGIAKTMIELIKGSLVMELNFR